MKAYISTTFGGKRAGGTKVAAYMNHRFDMRRVLQCSRCHAGFSRPSTERALRIINELEVAR